MRGVRILAACSPGEVRVAAMRDDTLVDYAIWRPGRPDGVGDLHRGRITALMPAMAGAFVALADGDGFLPDSEGAKALTEGAIIAVKVTRAALGGKGPRLTTRGADRVPPGPVGLIARGPGALDRFASTYADAPVVVDDPAYATPFRGRCSVAAKAFDDAVEARVEALADTEVALTHGARLSIHPTPALVAVDTDSGGRQDGHVAINRSIIPAIAQEIRLRNLSGAIVVDLAGMPMRKRAALAPAFTAALADDPLKPRFLGFSGLGLAEILRTRVHPPLHELLAGPHAAGLLALRQIVRDVAPARQPALRASPAVVEALRSDPVALPELARRTGRPLALRSDPSLLGTRWELDDNHG